MRIPLAATTTWPLPNGLVRTSTPLESVIRLAAGWSWRLQDQGVWVVGLPAQKQAWRPARTASRAACKDRSESVVAGCSSQRTLWAGSVSFAVSKALFPTAVRAKFLGRS